MAIKSKIEWTEATWNPVTGCNKISPGCDNCYAERIAERFRGTPGYPEGFDVTVHPSRFAQPLSWKRPRHIFVNSMSDLFHKEIEDTVRIQIFDVMFRAHWHQFQVLTKRSSLMRDFINVCYPDPAKPLQSNIWLGVSVESAQQLSRIEHLRSTNCSVRFLSIEPLLGSLGKIDLTGIHWVIVGGESGPGARPMHPDWVREIRQQCLSQDVPFFFKQWGEWQIVYDRDSEDPDWRSCPSAKDNSERYLNLAGGHGFHGDRVVFARRVGKKKSGRLLDGIIWDEMPEVGK